MSGPQRGASQSPQRTPPQQQAIPRGTILIVDDDPVVTHTFARLLALRGYDVRTALDAEAGLSLVETSHPDAILLDLRMPSVDGLGFLRQLRAAEGPHTTPVGVITGDFLVDDAMTRTLRELGAAVYFKPLWIEELFGIAQQLVESSATAHGPSNPAAH